MSASAISLNPYDEVPFPSQALPQTQPDRMAAIGILFGMNPPPANRCRVLELGSATGGNLLPMAEHFPESHFVGVDYARVQVQAAERAASLLRLNNIEFHHADINSLDDRLGKFDYIICHGVYSWVSNDLQRQILQLVKRSLTPQGIAYVSYNTNPGWYLRLMLREMMLMYAPPGGTAVSRLAKGRALLEFFAKAGERQKNSYGELLKIEAQSILKQPDGYIYHEYYESDNRPLYFHQFMEQAQAAGLLYLGEAAVATMFASNFGPKAEQYLKDLCPDLISIEQHLDILRTRGFRQTLLCHPDAPIRRHLLPDRIANLYFSGRLAPVNPNLDVTLREPQAFKTPNGMELTTPAPALKITLTSLNDAWPHALSFQEILAVVARKLGHAQSTDLPASVTESLGQNMIQCIASGLLEINSQPDSFTTTISDRPLVSRFARAEARTSPRATNQRNEVIDIGENARHVLTYLDGQHDQAAVLSELMAAVDRGEISILKDGVPATSGESVRATLQTMLDEALRKLAASALLIQ
jgi:methyltransferase-like protein/SAM-dependent methyltransferase